MNIFKQIYLLAMYAKFYMGIYFVALVVLTSAMQYLYGSRTLPITVLFQMLGVSVVISIFQSILLNDTADYSRGIFFTRSIVWLILSVVLVMISATYGQWLINLPSFCFIALSLLMLSGLVSMLVGLKWEQNKA